MQFSIKLCSLIELEHGNIFDLSATDGAIDTLETTSADISSAGSSGLQQQNLHSELKGSIYLEQHKGCVLINNFCKNSIL